MHVAFKLDMKDRALSDERRKAAGQQGRPVAFFTPAEFAGMSVGNSSYTLDVISLIC